MDNKLITLNFLGKHQGQSFTMHELGKLTHIPYATFFRVMGTLSDLVVKNKAGRATLVQINADNPLNKHYLIISSIEEAEQFLKTQALLKKITQELPKGEYSLVLFGSYAKGTQTTRSDIDLLVISKKGRKEPSFSRYETLFKIRINPLYITSKEFSAMLHDKEENIGKQALKNHIILHNPVLFWDLAYGI